jgi:hypothetical protein
MSCEVNIVGGVAAIGFATLIGVANLVLVSGGFPTPGADLGRVAQYFSGKRVPLSVACAACPTAWLLAVMFGGAAVVAIGPRASDLGAAWALAGFAGLLLQNATFTAVVALRLALAKTRGEGAQTLWAVHDAALTLNGSFLALAMVGLTLAGHDAGLVGPWHAAIGLLSAALLFTSATLAPLVVEHGGRLGLIGLAGWLFWVVWLVWYGIAFLADSGCPVG